jgi:hypothetical protein
LPGAEFAAADFFLAQPRNGDYYYYYDVDNSIYYPKNSKNVNDYKMNIQLYYSLYEIFSYKNYNNNNN